MKPLFPCALLLSLLAFGSLAVASEQANYEAAAKYSEGKKGRSLLIMKAGKVVFERYANGHDETKAHVLHSGTKSFWGVLAMVAVGEGKLKLDELACKTLTEWKDDPRKNKITVRHLLNLTSGLDPAGNRLRAKRTTRKYAAALKVEALDEPGAVYRYGPSHFYAFGELLKRKVKRSPLDYLRDKILDPIGLRVEKWEVDGAGDPWVPAGAYLTAREWIKFGELLRQKGAWKGKQLVKADLLAECFKGSKANPAYGLTFWLSADGIGPIGEQQKAPGPKELVFAAGYANQRLLLIPSKELVVVRQGDNDRAWSDAAFVAHLLGTPQPTAEDRAQALEAKAKVLADNWFQRFDKDEDGVVRKDEWPRLQARRLARWDFDKDGDLSPEEVRRVMVRRLRLLQRR